MMNSNYLLKKGALFSLFSFINNGISFVILLLIAKFITTSGYGELNIFNTTITLLAIIISLNTTGYYSVVFFNKKQVYIKSVFSSIVFLSTIVFSFFVFFCFFFSHILFEYTNLSLKWYIIAATICFSQVIINMLLDVYRLEEQICKYGFFSLSICLFHAIITLIFIFVFNYDWEGRAYSQLITSLIFLILSGSIVLKNHRLGFFDISVVKDSLIFGLPLIPHALSCWIRQGFDRYIINYNYDSTVVAIFSFAFNISSIVLIIGTAFNATLSVQIFKILSNPSSNEYRALNKQINIALLVILFLSLSILLLSYWLIPIFLPKYVESLTYLFPLCLSAYLQCVYFKYVNVLFFYNKTKKLMNITIFISAIHLLFSLIFVPLSPLVSPYMLLLTNFLITFLVRREVLNFMKRINL